jgi:uncharacterized protein YceK
MARASRAAALWIASLFLCGCGTVANLETGARQGWKNAYIYGGVRRDIQSEKDWIAHSWTWGKNLDVIQDIGSAVGVVLVGIDVPISAVGDTLTLPLTVPVAIWSNAVNRANVRGNPAPDPASPVAVVPVSEQPILNNPAANAAPSPYPATNGAGSPYNPAANAPGSPFPAPNTPGSPYSANQQR